ncbi:hypothetical protein [Nocardioides sp.]|uniref:hypothetical protein n=1 Tax=Nocardioides sp. TaxID=35761 RepID=UPI002601C194|nr:hypothetical protein [Nocardioides sp.]MDI6911344.1 hypothetical protein [Nocardioides sp.]
MIARRWWRRLVGGAVAYAALEVGLELAQADPDPVRLALLVAGSVAVLGLLRDALADGGASWDIEVERPSLRERGDPRLRQYLGLLEAHLAARTPDPALRDRLTLLATRALQRPGIEPGTQPETPPETQPAWLWDGPARRLTPAEIDRCLTQIEEL